MEFQILIDICFIIFTINLRFKIYQGSRKWYLFFGYIICLLAILIKLDWTMQQVRIHFANSVLEAIEPSVNIWLLPIAKFYANYDPIIKLLFITLSIELIACCYFIAIGLLRNKLKINLSLKSAMIRWWANIILFLGAPALVYGLLGLSSATEKSLMSIKYCLSVVIAAYGMPAYLLGIHPAPSDYLGGSSSYQPIINLNNFYQDAAPWFIFCLLITVVPYFLFKKSRQEKSISLRQLFLGDLIFQEYFRFPDIKKLPWRGILMLGFFVICLVLTLFAIVLNFLFYGIFVLIYHIVWIIPIFLILIVMWILIRYKSR